MIAFLTHDFKDGAHHCQQGCYNSQHCWASNVQQLPTLLGQQCWDLKCIVGRIQPLSLCKLHGDHVKCPNGPNNVGRAAKQINIVVLRFGGSWGSKVWPVSNRNNSPWACNKRMQHVTMLHPFAQDETEDFAFSTNLFYFSSSLLVLSFPNVEIRVYLQMGDTWINVGVGVKWLVFQQMWRVLYPGRGYQRFSFLACDEELRRPQADMSSTDLTETASSESKTQGQSVGLGEKARRKFSNTFVAPFLPSATDSCPLLSEDAETGNRAWKASGTQGKSIITHMWEYLLGPLYLHGTCNPKYFTRTVLIFSTWHVMTRRVCLNGAIIGQQTVFLS